MEKDKKLQPQHQEKKFIGTDNPKIETKRILIFLAVTFLISWVTEIFVIVPMRQSGDSTVMSQASSMLSSIMFAPAFGALVARVVTKEGLGHSGLQFNFAQHKFCFLFGWFGPSVLTFLGVLLYFAIYPDNYDGAMSNLVNAYHQAGMDTDAVEIMANYKTQILMNVFTAPLTNIIVCFGEEWGWRGYLLPKMNRKLGTLPMLLVNGVIWGIWYAPLTILLGQYYGKEYAGYPVTGVLATCVFCTVMGIIFSYITMKSGSIFPAIFAHGALNSMVSMGVHFTKDGGNPFIGPAATGIIGGLPFVITAVILMVIMIKHPFVKEKKEQGQ